MLKIRIRITHQTHGVELRSAFGTLDGQFGGQADVFNPYDNVGILALADRPVGSAKLDIEASPPEIGWLYVESDFRDKKVALEDTPWLGIESGYYVWQYMVKAAYIIARRAGYPKVESYYHNKDGERARDWRDSQALKWEAEVALKEPRELITLIRARSIA